MGRKRGVRGVMPSSFSPTSTRARYSVRGGMGRARGGRELHGEGLGREITWCFPGVRQE